MRHFRRSTPSRLPDLYHKELGDRRRERQLLSSVGFFVALAGARAVTHAQHRRPARLARLFRRPRRHRHHHHHLVAGILLLLADGYAWLFQVGTGTGRSSAWGSRLTSLLYGIGSALTLDEFALWLDLKDEYWSREGRKSIDAALLFGSLLSIGIWGGRFFRAVGRQATRVPGR